MGRIKKISYFCMLMGGSFICNSEQNAKNYTLDVHWSGTRGYKKFFSTSPLSEHSAHVLMKNIGEQHGLRRPDYPNIPSSSGVIFVYDEYMFFSFSGKG